MKNLPDNPKDFYKIIPTDVVENLKFRIELHQMLAVDSKMQEWFFALCKAYYPIFFSTVAFTYNPQMPEGEENRPFILRPAQIPAVERLDWCINNGKDVGINKSRKQGASEICCKLLAAKALLEKGRHFIVGSRTKDYVDNFGDSTTLFAKIDSVFENLPSWWLERSGYEPKKCRKDMNLVIPSTKSAFTGDTTNENFSAGSRATALLLDEFGRVDYGLAQAIEGSVHDVTNCVIYSSTHWLGKNHTFNKCINKPTTELIELYWYTSPVENYGLYRTSEPGKIEIIDKEYYTNEMLDNAIYLDNIQQYNPDEERMQFIADGLKGIPSPYRAPWFDLQHFKRRGDKRDFICNVCGQALGAAETPFDHTVLEEVADKDIYEPDYAGELTYQKFTNGRINDETVDFRPTGAKRLKWWGRLLYNRPNQRHNYIIAVDPSYGLGSANAAVIVYDRNLGEQVGSFTDANTQPHDLADYVVALAYWCGGAVPAFIIWDAGGGCGTMFTDRLLFHNYPYLYTQRREDSKTRKITQKWGWIGKGKAKDSILGGLSVALGSGVTSSDEYVSMTIHDEYLLEELFDYIFKDNGQGAVVSSKADLSTGALERHGDRVIACALCILACKDIPKADWRKSLRPPINSFQHRYNKVQEEVEKNKDKIRKFLF